MNKLLAFRFKDYSNIIYGEYRANEDKIYYKHINPLQIGVTFFENVEDITENHIDFFTEDNEIWRALINNIKEDTNLLDKIKSNKSNKLLFQYEYIEIN